MNFRVSFVHCLFYKNNDGVSSKSIYCYPRFSGFSNQRFSGFLLLAKIFNNLALNFRTCFVLIV